ncbi:MAG: hypothetical protein M0C28_47705 [Candidatus Moduliflexus flocculans]|nr:hypothetical protein [Candidatus Moduliflexus flocculans]
MTYIKQAKAPDAHPARRARQARAHPQRLRAAARASRTRASPSKLVVYKGFGHGITKPKSMRAVMEHNLAWFGHYIFGDPKPDLAAPPLPKKDRRKTRRRGTRQ